MLVHIWSQCHSVLGHNDDCLHSYKSQSCILNGKSEKKKFIINIKPESSPPPPPPPPPPPRIEFLIPSRIYVLFNLSDFLLQKHPNVIKFLWLDKYSSWCKCHIPQLKSLCILYVIECDHSNSALNRVCTFFNLFNQQYCANTHLITERQSPDRKKCRSVPDTSKAH